MHRFDLQQRRADTPLTARALLPARVQRREDALQPGTRRVAALDDRHAPAAAAGGRRAARRGRRRATAARRHWQTADLEVDDQPAAGVAADVPRRLAHPARFVLRPRPARREPGGRDGEVRALSAEALVEQRPELPVPGNDGRNDRRPPWRRRRRATRGADDSDGLARRGLRGRRQPLSLPADLQRRELEPAAARAADRAGRQRRGGRLPARGRRPRRHHRDSVYSFFEARAGKQVALRVGPERQRRRRARRRRGAGAIESRACARSPGSKTTGGR